MTGLSVDDGGVVMELARLGGCRPLSASLRYMMLRPTTKGRTAAQTKRQASKLHSLPFELYKHHPSAQTRLAHPSSSTVYHNNRNARASQVEHASSFRRHSLIEQFTLSYLSCYTLLFPPPVMENSFRRYLNSKRPSSAPTIQSNSVDYLDLYSVPYEKTVPASRSPIFISQPLRRSAIATKAKDDMDGLATRAVPYNSVVAGKPPIHGGRPYKGNGPVKLQTNRRLSTGELLATTQDHQRTLEDILEGDYIVGRKEKRMSQISQSKPASPFLGGPASPRDLSTAFAAKGRHYSQTSVSQMPPSPTPMWHHEISPPPTAPDDKVQPQQYNPVRDDTYKRWTSRSQVPSSPASLLTRGEEQNTTIQALWKAEYTRLVAMYGQDGVDRNITELNRQRTPSLDRPVESPHLPNAMTLQPPPKSSFESAWASSSARVSRSSFARDSGTFEEASDHSSYKPSSIMSSEESSSSYTKRTSLYEPELPTTREDVRRAVESMRSNYLKAIESTTKEPEKAKTKRKPKMRASLPNGSTPEKPFISSKTSRAGRQSWHPSNEQRSSKSAKKTTKHKLVTVQAPPPLLKSPSSKASLVSKSSMQRADSLTLGALVMPVPSLKKSAKTADHLAEPVPTFAQHDGLQSQSDDANASSVAIQSDDHTFFDELSQSSVPRTSGGPAEYPRNTASVATILPDILFSNRQQGVGVV